MAMTNAERSARYLAKYPERRKNTVKRWEDRNKEWRRQYRRRNALKKYGLTPEKFEEILVAQGGGCAICPRKQSGSFKGWHVDHCHKNKVVRGILCAHCNRLLGAAGDNEEILRSAILYLQRKDYICKVQAHLAFFKARENRTRVPIPKTSP